MPLETWPRAATTDSKKLAAEIAERERLIVQADCKFCPTCKTTKARAAFARWQRGRDGLQTQCKACNATYRKTEAYRATDRKYTSSEKGRVVDTVAHRRYHQTENGKATLRRTQRTSRERWPEKHRARRLLNHAVQCGRLVRQPCEKCGKTPAQGHHHRGYDPEHALDVQWLCSSCHREEHRETA